MSLEQRLRDALHEADNFEPSPDLFARVHRSITEYRQHRRRLGLVGALIVAGILTAGSYFRLVVREGAEGLIVSGWQIALFDVVLLGILLIVLGPNIRRFARSYVSDLFHMSPRTGDRFLIVMDIAYYVLFSGLILVDADVYGPLFDDLLLTGALAVLADRVGFFLGAMGVLHATNIVALPVVSLIFNSLTRKALRREAGREAPVESPTARKAESTARAIGIVVMVLIGAGLSALVVGPLFGLLLGG